MTNFDRLIKLASSFYRQARASTDAMKRRALRQRGDWFSKKAQELQREQLAVQAIYPKSESTTGQAAPPPLASPAEAFAEERKIVDNKVKGPSA